MKRIGLFVAALAIVFASARAIHAARLEHAEPIPLARESARAGASPQKATHAPSREAMLGTRPATAEIHATALESPDARELRHEAQLAQIHQRAPDLPAATADKLVRIADQVAEQSRKLRTSFLLDELTEDEYLENRRAAIREGFFAARAVLTKEQLARVFQWNNDMDPFDPEGSTER